MRKALLLFCFCFSLGAALGWGGHSVPMGALPHPLSIYTAPASIGRWLINDGGSATTALDSSGAGNNGTWSGGGWCSGSYYTTGYVLSNSGCFVSVRSVNINVGNISSLNFERTNAFTLTAWVYPTSTTFANGASSIISKIDYGGTGGGYCLRTLGSQVAVDIGNNSGDLRRYSAASLAANSWTFVAVSYNGSSTASGINVYVNGALSNGTIYSDNLAGGTIQNPAPFYIGIFGPASGPFQPWEGQIEDVRVFNRELTGAEIAGLYGAGPGA